MRDNPLKNFGRACVAFRAVVRGDSRAGSGSAADAKNIVSGL
jgi:hypothetical protein